MNEAAQELCLQNPALLQKRIILIDEARSKIIAEGFQFVKGKSRSKKMADPDEQQRPAKRRKLSKDVREQRLKEIEEDCKDIAERLSFKEKRIAAYENSREYKKCDEVKEEITALKHQRRQLEAEAKCLKKSSSQSRWYFDSKKQRARGSHSGNTTLNSDASDTLSGCFWKSHIEGQSTASLTSSESTPSTPAQSKPMSHYVVDLTRPCKSPDDNDSCWEGMPQEDPPVFLDTTDSTVITTSTTINASSTSAAPSSDFVATASSLMVPIAASASPTSPMHIDSTVLTNSVGVLSSAALAPPLPSSSESASVIEVLLSQSDILFVDCDFANENNSPGVIPHSSATTASHSPFIVASSPSPVSSSISLNPLATNIEDLLSRCLPQQSTGSDEGSSPSVASCDTSPSVVEMVLSHHAPELSSPIVSSLENNTDASEEQLQDGQTSF